MAKIKTGIKQTETQAESITDMRPSYLEIDLDAFNNNFRKIKSAVSSDSGILAVVKANAYGHGLVRIALQAEKCGADMVGVAFVEEGERLLEAGVKIPIVVLYPDTVGRASRIVNAGLNATVDSTENLKALNSAAVSVGKIVKVFLKAETGMARFGACEDEIKELISLAVRMSGVEIIGITTNLADSNNGDDSFTVQQFNEFTKMIESANLKSNNSYLSIENSSGFLYHHNKNFNLVRIGLLLYGVSPKKDVRCEFTPVMSLNSRIIRLKKWPAGKPVGYGGSFVPQRDITIATIGLGYADGYPWSLSNKGYVLINGRRAPVIGKICMDAVMIDVTDIPDARINTEVVLLGKSGNEAITAEELAEIAGSFSYEFISGFSDRLPRVYKEK